MFPVAHIFWVLPRFSNERFQSRTDEIVALECIQLLPPISTEFRAGYVKPRQAVFSRFFKQILKTCTWSLLLTLQKVISQNKGVNKKLPRVSMTLKTRRVPWSHPKPADGSPAFRLSGPLTISLRTLEYHPGPETTGRLTCVFNRLSRLYWMDKIHFAPT